MATSTGSNPTVTFVVDGFVAAVKKKKRKCETVSKQKKLEIKTCLVLHIRACISLN